MAEKSTNEATGKNQISAPAVFLPNGGGAIRGMGESLQQIRLPEPTP